MSDGPNLGPCCSCGSSRSVHTVIMLDRKAPIAGKGWGCAKCGLAADGAVAVLCSACMRACPDDQEYESMVRQACVGYPSEGKRIPIADLPPGVHEHRMDFHSDEIDYETAQQQQGADET